MKITKKDLLTINNLLFEKITNLRFSLLELETLSPYISSYDYLEEEARLNNQINDFTNLRNKILKMMED